MRNSPQVKAATLRWACPYSNTGSRNMNNCNLGTIVAGKLKGTAATDRLIREAIQDSEAALKRHSPAGRESALADSM